MKVASFNRNRGLRIRCWQTALVVALLTSCTAGETSSPGQADAPAQKDLDDVFETDGVKEQLDAAAVTNGDEELGTPVDAVGDAVEATLDAASDDTSDAEVMSDVGPRGDVHSDTSHEPQETATAKVDSSEDPDALEDAEVRLTDASDSRSTDVGEDDHLDGLLESDATGTDVPTGIAGADVAELDEPLSAEYREAVLHFPDLPKPKKGSTEWQPSVSATQPEICAQWATQGWKALDVNPCDAPVATAEAQAELALVPSTCGPIPWKALNVISMVDIEAELLVQELDYTYALGGIGQIWAIPPDGVGIYSGGPGNSSSPIKSTYVRVRHFTSGGELVSDAIIGDKKHSLMGLQLKLGKGGKLFLVERTIMDYTTKISLDGYPWSLAELLPWFVYEFDTTSAKFPEPVSLIGPIGTPWDARETQDGFLLASEATSIEVEGNPCVDVALRHVTIDGGLQWTRYFALRPGETNGLGKVSVAAKSVRAVPIGECGYAVSFRNIYKGPTPWGPGGPLLTPEVFTVNYLSRDGSVTQRVDYAVGYWANTETWDSYLVTDGEDLVLATYTNGLMLPVPQSTGKTTSVLRLGPDAKPKAFTVLSGIGGGGFPNAMLALPSKAVVMSIGADGTIVVLGPDLCPILKYDGFSDLVAGGVVEIVRVNDTLFAAHDKYRLYFFELPELYAWEQPQAQAAP